MAITGEHALAILTGIISELVTPEIKNQLDTVYNNMSVDQTSRYFNTSNEQIDQLVRKLSPHILDTNTCKQLFSNERLPVRLEFAGRFDILCYHLRERGHHRGEVPSEIPKLFETLMIGGYYSPEELFPFE